MQITLVNADNNVGIILSQEEAKIMYSLLIASAQPGGGTTPRRFVRMIKNAFDHIGITTYYSNNTPEESWILHANSRIRDFEGGNLS